MLGIAKQVLLQGIERFGYVLLKKDAHQDLVARAAGPAPGESPPPASVALPMAPMPVEPPPVAGSLPWPVAPPGLFPFAAKSEFVAFRRQLADAIDLPEHRILALFSAARHLVTQRVAGDVVDCTHAAGKVLAVLAASFVFLRDTSRRLVLFDPTANPHHRAELVLEAWGNDYDLIGDKRRPPRSPRHEPAPDAVRATGYPKSKLMVQRYPREPIAASDPIAFVGFTTETYPANRMTVAALLAQLAPGGILTVDRISRSDAVADHLAAHHIALVPSEVAEHYLMAIRT